MSFTYHPSLQQFNVTVAQYLSKYSEIPRPDGSTQTVSAIGSGACVITQSSPSSAPRILLLRRAATDSMPNLWEVPGGAVDDTDETILHGVARELREEAGLTATQFQSVVGQPHVFGLRRRAILVAKIQFLCEIQSGEEVVLDEKEHSAFVWAKKEDCEKGYVLDGGEQVDIPFTTAEQKEVVLEAFEVWNQVRATA